MSGPGFDEVAEVARGRMLGTLFELLGRLHWTGPTLEEHRTSALAEMLTFAGEHSTWHAERLGTVDPAGVTPNDLSALPTMTKADLMANWDGIVTDPRLSLDLVREHLAQVDREGLSFLLDEYVVLTTGGSTGEPGIFAWSLDEWSRWAATNARLGADHGDPPPERLTYIGAGSTRHASAIPPRVMYGAEAGARQSVGVDQPIAAIVDQLNAINPDSIWMLSSILPALADAKMRGQLRITPFRIAVGGDAVDGRAFDAAEAAFDVRPIETYPTTDVGHIAAQAPGEEGMVVNDDLMIVEPVNEDDRPVPPGELSHHLLVTSLHQRTLPLIRYRIDDRVRFHTEPGRYAAYSRIAEIKGRSDDLLTYGAVTVHPHTFRTVLSKHPEVTDYQVRQTDRGADVLVVAHAHLEGRILREELVSQLEAAGLDTPSVTVRRVSQIPRSPAGKRLLFVGC